MSISLVCRPWWHPSPPENLIAEKEKNIQTKTFWPCHLALLPNFIFVDLIILCIFGRLLCPKLVLTLKVSTLISLPLVLTFSSYSHDCNICNLLYKLTIEKINNASKITKRSIKLRSLSILEIWQPCTCVQHHWELGLNKFPVYL